MRTTIHTAIFVILLLLGVVGCSQDATEIEATIDSILAPSVEEGTPIPGSETGSQLDGYVIYSPGLWESPESAQADIEPLLAEYQGLSIQGWVTETEAVLTTIMPTVENHVAIHNLPGALGVTLVRQIPVSWLDLDVLEEENCVPLNGVLFKYVAPLSMEETFTAPVISSEQGQISIPGSESTGIPELDFPEFQVTVTMEPSEIEMPVSSTDELIEVPSVEPTVIRESEIPDLQVTISIEPQEITSPHIWYDELHDFSDLNSRDEIVHELMENHDVNPYVADVIADMYWFHCRVDDYEVSCPGCSGCPDPVAPICWPPGPGPISEGSGSGASTEAGSQSVCGSSCNNDAGENMCSENSDCLGACCNCSSSCIAKSETECRDDSACSAECCTLDPAE
ncbi:MAG: hypothetical protein M9928_23175 [Anaerolineae bacterium]|nr:hypothetical protein [Anaerolineae bacterium]MCO5194741.1 hypothetical protein [Anaerolineae bacterium]MCO5207913.1 hypothetical protein [Anaerolineae bacterium]